MTAPVDNAQLHGRMETRRHIRREDEVVIEPGGLTRPTGSLTNGTGEVTGMVDGITRRTASRTHAAGTKPTAN
jgi:hypothetical protein